MPIILSPSTTLAATQTATTTAQNVIIDASNEVRNVVGSAGDDLTLMLGWTNRIQLSLLRASRWTFLLSDTQYFITEREQIGYWLGPSNQLVAGNVDTALGLTDLDIIMKNSVRDLSNDRVLERTDEPPYSQTLATRDAQFRPGKPAEWRQDALVPNLINIFPAPDNQNSYQPVPESAYCQATSGGALALRTYYVQLTLLDSSGNESTPAMREAIITLPASNLLVVKSPKLPFSGTTSGVTYNKYHVYASTVSQSETRQTGSSPISIGTDWTEPTSGLVTGVAMPTVNNLTTMDGYIIGFRYYKKRQIVTQASDILQIPDIYRDIMVAGVTWRACHYLRIREEAQYWMGEFMDGVRQMVKDRNLFPKENDYLAPDYAGIGIGTQVPYIDVFDYLR